MDMMNRDPIYVQVQRIRYNSGTGDPVIPFEQIQIIVRLLP